MRFYVPNMEEQEEDEEESGGEEEGKATKSKKKAPKEEKKQAKGEGEGEEGEEEDSEEDITPAKLFNDQILKYASLGDGVGDVIASFQDMHLAVPRGKYTLNMYENYAKFHGKTHDYKILYKDISRLF